MGSDYKKSDKVISSGEIIDSSHILAFKTLGINKIIVKKKPVIIFYSTGNEISEKLIYLIGKLEIQTVTTSNLYQKNHFLKLLMEEF